jgi:hypothetical protein
LCNRSLAQRIGEAIRWRKGSWFFPKLETTLSAVGDNMPMGHIMSECRLGECIRVQKETVGLAKGGQPYQSTGSARELVAAPTLADAGIDKKLSSREQRVRATAAQTVALCRGR